MLQERNLAVDFTSRLVSLGKQKNAGCDPAAACAPTRPQDFLAFCSPESVKLIFTQLLAPPSWQEEQGEAEGEAGGGSSLCHCSLSLPVMKCIEKFFCWLGIHQGYLELTHKPPATSACLARNYFAILRPLSEHTEWQVFLAIIMTVAEVRERGVRGGASSAQVFDDLLNSFYCKLSIYSHSHTYHTGTG